jgi:hypothetical protein
MRSTWAVSAVFASGCFVDAFAPAQGGAGGQPPIPGGAGGVVEVGGAGAGGAAMGGAATGGAPAGGAGGSGASGAAGAQGGGGAGPCALDFGEGCEDCNEVGGDGCTTHVVDVGYHCAGETAPQLCAALSSIAFGDPVATPVYGSGGGSPGEMDCPANTAAVGLGFDFLADGRLESVRLRCSPVEFSDGGKLSWSSATGVADDFGGPYTEEVVVDCSQAQFFVGAELSRLANDTINSVALECAELQLEGDRIVFGPAVLLAPQGNVSTQVELRECSQPTDVVVGIHGREGLRIDEWELQCAPLIPGFCGDGVVTEPEDCDDPSDAGCVDCTD